ncbi:MAG: heme-binding protein [Sphingobacteriaceae bacterium]|nr:heme-binding protein [Sphingobacteriaceae bacterium]
MKSYINYLTTGTLLCSILLTSPVSAKVNHHIKPILSKNDSLYLVNKQLTLKAANFLAESARYYAKTLNKEVAIAVVDAGGNILLINRDNSTGPHNADAAKLKAYTAMSTKTATLLLDRNAKSNPNTANLATVSGLLLLGGGVPVFNGDKVIGAIGIAGGGGPENDDNIAKYAVLELFKNKNTKK